MVQTLKQDHWIDESGNKVQVKRLTQLEKQTEKDTAAILKAARKINDLLKEFKEDTKARCADLFYMAMAAENVKTDSKGNYTIYNFDRSIKVVVSVSERIDFDDMKIAACKAKLDEFINLKLNSEETVLREFVVDAFTTSRGKLDSKKVMNLLRYKTKVNDTLFTEAMELLEQSIRKPESKQYIRVFERDEEGNYENIELNFSSL